MPMRASNIAAVDTTAKTYANHSGQYPEAVRSDGIAARVPILIIAYSDFGETKDLQDRTAKMKCR
jgi:hypothetical protein